MEIIPAIDIRGGRCVRLRQGDYSAETVFDDDPIAVAQRWLDAGASRLHVVDLDGARDGVPTNFDLIAAIAHLDVPVQTGGGIRTAETVGRYRDAGVHRVIIGTAAVADPSFVEQLCRDHGSAVVVSLDARNNRLATDGWTRTSNLDVVDFALELAEAGVQRFIYTDIARDGMLTEPNYDSVRRLIDRVLVPVIASGGMANVKQIAPIAATGAEAVIIGRALYDGRIDIVEAIHASRGAA
jgi:phosphoribosylformimino-5-aminoimidazole carboxamide ribotide isomerase